MSKQIISSDQLDSYSSKFSESGFWSVIAKVSPTIARTALELYYVLMGPTTPLSAKATIMGALGYLIFPIDLIPDFIPIVGWTDDAAALVAAYKTVKEYVTPAIKAKVDKKLGAA